VQREQILGQPSSHHPAAWFGFFTTFSSVISTLLATSVFVTSLIALRSVQNPHTVIQRCRGEFFATHSAVSQVLLSHNYGGRRALL
jgi:hypothetical protein